MITFSGVDFLYRSGDLTPQDLLTDIKKFNIKKVISLDSQVGNKFAKILPANIKHIMNPINIGSDSLAAARDLALKIKNNFMVNTAGEPLLVHCAAGKDRTGLAIALYKEIKKNANCIDVIKEAKSFGGLGPSIGVAADQFIQVICENCKANHQHYNQENQKPEEKTEDKLDTENNSSNEVTLNLSDISSADDIATLMREHMSGPTPPAVNPQQSFAPFMDPNVDRYPGIVMAKSKVKLLKKILKKAREDRVDYLLKLAGFPSSKAIKTPANAKLVSFISEQLGEYAKCNSKVATFTKNPLLLTNLSFSAFDNVLSSVANNKSTPDKILEKLISTQIANGDSCNHYIWNSALLNLKSEDKIISALQSSKDNKMTNHSLTNLLINIVNHKNPSVKLLYYIADNFPWNFQMCLKYLGLNEIRQLLKLGDDKITAALSSLIGNNANLPLDILQYFIDFPDENIRILLTQQECLDESGYKKLMEDPSPRVRNLAKVKYNDYVLLQAKETKIDSNNADFPQIGEVNNYQGAPNSQFSAPSGAPGAPNSAAFSDPGGWVQL